MGTAAPVTTDEKRCTTVPFVRGVAVSSIVTYLGIATSLLSAPLLARSLGATGRGELAAIFAPLQLLSWTCFLGIPRFGAVVRTRGRGYPRRSFVVLTALGVVAAVGLWAAAPLLAGGASTVESGIRALCWLLVFGGVAQLGVESLQARGRVVAWNAVRGIPLLLPSLLQILLWGFGALTLPAAIATMALGQLVWTVTGVLVWARGAMRRRAGRIDWRFSLGYWTTTALDGVGGRIDQVVLAAFATAADLGRYVVAVTIANAAGAVTQALGHTTFADRIRGADTRFDARVARMGVVTSVVTGAVVVAVTAVSGTTVLGASFDGLTVIVAILVVHQLLHDQWQFAVYRGSADLDASRLMVPSLVGVVVLCGCLAVLGVAGAVSGAAVALAMVAFAATRYGVWLLI
ncbi:hypothetical protein, partial [Rhodococcus rhodnii]